MMRLLLLTCPHLLMHQRSAAMSAEGKSCARFLGGWLIGRAASHLAHRQTSIPSSASLIQLRQPAWQRGDSSVFTVH